jgi:hypothetical protein
MPIHVDPEYVKEATLHGTAIVVRNNPVRPTPSEEILITIEDEDQLLVTRLAAVQSLITRARSHGVGSVPVRLLEMALELDPTK